MSYIGNEPIVSATRTITEVTATAGQTVFVANGGYTVGYIDVFLNGAQLQTVDFTATDGSSITLTEAAQVGDVLKLVAWGTFSTSNLVSPNYTGTLTGGTDVVNIGSGQVYKDASGNVGIGTSSPQQVIEAVASNSYFRGRSTGGAFTGVDFGQNSAGDGIIYNRDASKNIIFYNNAAERMRIDGSGNLLVGKTAVSETTNGITLSSSGASSTDAYIFVTNTRADALGTPLLIGRQGSDGNLVSFRQAGTQEGTISVSGTTVSYNGGHLARFAQTVGVKDESLLKGTVLSNLDEMNTYVDEEGNPVANEQLNKVKVSDVEGDADVAGVFVNWSYDEQHSVDEINMAMTGDMIIRIAQGVTVNRGDLLMSAGDGTAKPQGDDIVRSKTIAKVTSTNITCTYADGSYCVPCVLMAC